MERHEALREAIDSRRYTSTGRRASQAACAAIEALLERPEIADAMARLDEETLGRLIDNAIHAAGVEISRSW